MDNSAMEAKLAELERKVEQLTQVVKGVDIATQGWEGERLTVGDLRFKDQQRQTPTLAGTWVGNPVGAYPNTQESGVIIRKLDQRVAIYISIQGGAANPITTLPVGYRPPYQIIFPVEAAGGLPAFCVIQQDGLLAVYAAPNNTITGYVIYLVDPT